MSPPPTLDVREAPGGATLRLRVSPGARRSGLARREDGALLVRVAAPAVEGAANQELLRYLAREVLGLPRGALRLARGEHTRDKVLEVDLSPSELQARLLRALAEEAP